MERVDLHLIGSDPIQSVDSGRFRELSHEDRWSGYLEIHNSKRTDFERVIEQLANERSFTFYGWLLDESGEKFRYCFTRYHRKKFGPVPAIEMYRDLLKQLSDSLGVTGMQEQNLGRPKFRILLGLKERYDANSKTHNSCEVKSILGNGFEIVDAEIYSVGPWGRYTEPAVLIVEEKSKLDKVYDLAYTFKQSRFCVEDFQSGKSYMVETSYCNDPDPV